MRVTIADEPAVKDCGLRKGSPEDAVGGLVPGHVARPSDTAALGRVLRAASEHGLTVVARGGGTAQDWGGPLRSLDLVLDLGDLVWIDHNADDLVVEVGAGTPLAELRASLAASGQRLAHDPVRLGGTVGGALATGVSGPRRLLSGTLRDLVIGMTVVRADGTVARSGGRVVKNVAGYDLAKLHTGGYGTLGVISSAAFRLHPVPHALRVLSARMTSTDRAERALAALRTAAVEPAAVELERPAEAPVRLHVVLEGTPDGLRPRVHATAEALGGEPTVGEELPDGWGLFPTEGTLALLTTPPAESVAAATLVGEHCKAWGISAHVRGSAPSGTLWVSFPPGTGAEQIAAVADSMRTGRRTFTLLRSEAHVRAAGIDPWGTIPGLALMRAVKDSFDPDHRLAPGRFAGGI
ncbi:MAG TPA: FAD-binding oxidoreductase [Candidatus Nocardiopsis merdipullorum]|nr:FAD-binding oxidoreductase [Candidatus Nocardiopsis merdipullorum]